MLQYLNFIGVSPQFNAMTVGEEEFWAQGSPFGALKRQRGNFNPCSGADTNTWTTAHLQTCSRQAYM